jgi:hypothetical protein
MAALLPSSGRFCLIASRRAPRVVTAVIDKMARDTMA